MIRQLGVWKVAIRISIAVQDSIMISSQRSAIARSMSMGSHHRLIGLLKRSPRGPVIEVDGGGAWVLALDQDVRAMLGQRVVVERKRSGFDRLDVIWIGRQMTGDGS
jgi:hypothetical protein